MMKENTNIKIIEPKLPLDDGATFWLNELITVLLRIKKHNNTINNNTK